ncbi:hypothetical protein RYX36_034558 [Vicia faba]
MFVTTKKVKISLKNSLVIKQVQANLYVKPLLRNIFNTAIDDEISSEDDLEARQNDGEYIIKDVSNNEEETPRNEKSVYEEIVGDDSA